MLWANCDSPVEGVGEFVLSCFKVVLSTADKHVGATCLQLHHILLEKLLPMPWNVKAKLKLFTVLVPWIDSIKVRKIYL